MAEAESGDRDAPDLEPRRENDVASRLDDEEARRIGSESKVVRRRR